MNPEEWTMNRIVDKGVRIVILQRGWVMVGHLYKDSSEYILQNGFIIRRWGTTEGLGELAIKGKLSDTQLDAVPKVIFHELTVIAMIECVKEKWPTIK